MSRIGSFPVALPKGVEVKLAKGELIVKGPKGTISTKAEDCLDYKIDAEEIVVSTKEDNRYARSQHGLRRSLLANAVEGVSKGFTKTVEVIGVGYRVAVKGKTVELSLGFSHPVVVDLPEGIEASVEGQKLTFAGIDKELVGEIAARVRRLRKPEPYKGKGIRYENEQIRRKVGKSGGGKK